MKTNRTCEEQPVMKCTILTHVPTLRTAPGVCGGAAGGGDGGSEGGRGGGGESGCGVGRGGGGNGVGVGRYLLFRLQGHRPRRWMSMASNAKG